MHLSPTSKLGYLSFKFALIGNFLDTVDRGRKRAYVVEGEHRRLSQTGYFLSATSCMRL